MARTPTSAPAPKPERIRFPASRITIGFVYTAMAAIISWLVMSVVLLNTQVTSLGGRVALLSQRVDLLDGAIGTTTSPDKVADGRTE